MDDAHKREAASDESEEGELYASGDEGEFSDSEEEEAVGERRGAASELGGASSNAEHDANEVGKTLGALELEKNADKVPANEKVEPAEGPAPAHKAQGAPREGAAPAAEAEPVRPKSGAPVAAAGPEDEEGLEEGEIPPDQGSEAEERNNQLDPETEAGPEADGGGEAATQAPPNLERKPLEPYEVPTAGAFWMHDNRVADDAEAEPRKAKPRKKLWDALDDEKWVHDKFELLDLPPNLDTYRGSFARRRGRGERNGYEGDGDGGGGAYGHAPRAERRPDRRAGPPRDRRLRGEAPPGYGQGEEAGPQGAGPGAEGEFQYRRMGEGPGPADGGAAPGDWPDTDGAGMRGRAPRGGGGRHLRGGYGRDGQWWAQPPRGGPQNGRRGGRGGGRGYRAENLPEEWPQLPVTVPDVPVVGVALPASGADGWSPSATAAWDVAGAAPRAPMPGPGSSLNAAAQDFAPPMGGERFGNGSMGGPPGFVAGGVPQYYGGGGEAYYQAATEYGFVPGPMPLAATGAVLPPPIKRPISIQAPPGHEQASTSWPDTAPRAAPAGEASAGGVGAAGRGRGARRYSTMAGAMRDA